jgi:spore coat polysaccharide biosynthesis predicted glycosyltransferase SpsG
MRWNTEKRIKELEQFTLFMDKIRTSKTHYDGVLITGFNLGEESMQISLVNGDVIFMGMDHVYIHIGDMKIKLQYHVVFSKLT